MTPHADILVGSVYVDPHNQPPPHKVNKINASIFVMLPCLDVAVVYGVCNFDVLVQFLKAAGSQTLVNLYRTSV